MIISQVVTEWHYTHGQPAFLPVLENTRKTYQTKVCGDRYLCSQPPCAGILDFTVFLQARVHSTAAAYHVLPSLWVNTPASQSRPPRQSMQRWKHAMLRTPHREIPDKWLKSGQMLHYQGKKIKSRCGATEEQHRTSQSIQRPRFTVSSFGKLMTTDSQK